MPITRRRVLRACAGLGVGAATGTVAHATVYAPRQLELVEVSLPVSGLPVELHGLRVGLITDLHHSETVPLRDVQRAVDLLMDQRPDLVVLGGDYVTRRNRAYVAPCVEALRALDAPHGVFAVLGNHDDEPFVAGALEAAGFTVLQDARTRVEIRGAGLEIAGLRFWTRSARDIAPILRGASSPIILLAHDPRRLEQASALDVGLVLSGHTHGGQVVLPGLGAVAARRFPVVAGVARQRNTSLFVSRGVGTVVLPVRYNCPPDVALLTLTARSIL